MITAEEIVNTILNVNEEDEAVGEGVPAYADVMVRLEDGTIVVPTSLSWDKESNILFIEGDFF